MIISNKQLDLLKMAMEAETDATQDMFDDGDETLELQLVGEKDLLQLLQDEITRRTSGRFVDLDADTQIYYLNVLADYHSYLIGDMNSKRGMELKEIQGLMDECYILGNIEGRLVQGTISADDVELIEEWQDKIMGCPGHRKISLKVFGHMSEADLGEIMETLSHDFDAMGYEAEITETPVYNFPKEHAIRRNEE